MKSIVCYFSAGGTTAKYANQLAKSLNCDTLEIEPIEEYSIGDLNWQDKNSRSSQEMSNPKARVAFNKKLDNLNDYDTILLGFPIWWYTAPRIVNTFLESYDLSNKKIIIWATSGSSKMGSIVKVLKDTYPKLNLIEGKVINHISVKECIEWIHSITK